MLYESHLTFPIEYAEDVESYSKLFPKWKFSKIDGDPVLGKKVFCYLTTYDDDENSMRDRLMAVVASAKHRGFPPCRAKIEAIVYDERF